MRRWIGLLSRLYPPAWRERYGVEFDALLDEAPLRAADFLNVFQEAIKMRTTTWTAKEILLSSTFGGAVLAAAVALWLPNWYLTTAVLQVPAGRVATLPLVAENTLSRKVLAGLIDRHGLYAEERGRMSPDDLVNLMRRDIRVATVTSSTRKSTSVELQFRYPNPTRAQSVVRELSSKLQESTELSLLDPATSDVIGPNRRVVILVGLFNGLLLGSMVLLIRNHYKRASEA